MNFRFASLCRLPVVLLFLGCSIQGADESSILRGDEAAARGDLDAALAEYRLAVRRGSDEASTFARVAHTYAEMGRIDEAGNFYHSAVEHDPSFADQAVSDMVRLARAARDRSDLFGLASAMETAMSFRPGITMQDMALPLARHYFRSGEYATALPYYQSTCKESQGRVHQLAPRTSLGRREGEGSDPVKSPRYGAETAHGRVHVRACIA